MLGEILSLVLNLYDFNTLKRTGRLILVLPIVWGFLDPAILNYNPFRSRNIQIWEFGVL